MHQTREQLGQRGGSRSNNASSWTAKSCRWHKRVNPRNRRATRVDSVPKCCGNHAATHGIRAGEPHGFHNAKHADSVGPCMESMHRPWEPKLRRRCTAPNHSRLPSHPPPMVHRGVAGVGYGQAWAANRSDRAPDVRQVFAPTSGRRAHSCAPIQTRTGALYACRRGHFTSADCSMDSTAVFTDSVLLGMRGVGLSLWKGCVLPPAYMTSV